MTSFDFAEGEIPEKLTPGLDLDLFHQPRHLYLQSATGWTSFYITDKQTEKLLAFIWFHITDGEADSPFRSPYGSFWFVPDIAPIVLYDFIQLCEKTLLAKGVSQIKIKNPPSLYHPQKAILLNVLLQNNGYRITKAEFASVIEIKPRPFLDGVSEWEVRKYHMARKRDLQSKVLPLGELEQVYHFIAACRKEQGRQLSMTLPEVLKMAEIFPDCISLFGVTDYEDCVAASINIKVNKEVIYHFYGAHDAAYNKLSPVVMMMNEIYHYCQQAGVRYLDMGTSSSADQPNFSLLDFKTSLGAVVTEKLTFQKSLHP